MIPHASGAWQKKIRNKVFYFGRWATRVQGRLVPLPDDGRAEALKMYEAVAVDLKAGRTPRPSSDELTLEELCEEFLAAKASLVSSNELSQLTFRDLRQTAQSVCNHFGKQRLVIAIYPSDFTSLRAVFAERFGVERSEPPETLAPTNWGLAPLELYEFLSFAFFLLAVIFCRIGIYRSAGYFDRTPIFDSIEKSTSISAQGVIKMRILLVFIAFSLTTTGVAGTSPESGKLIKLQLETTLVPTPAAVDVLLPPGYDQLSEPVPLFIWLHGGSSGKDHLEKRMKPYLEKSWQSGDLIPCVVVTPVTGSSYYIDWHDGTKQWETFITGHLLAHIRKRFKVRQNRSGTVIAGASAGGQGTLRIALRHPELFVAAAAMEPGFPPVLNFDDWDISGFGPKILPVLHARFGDPIDKRFWRSIHPPTLVIDNPGRLRESGLQLLVEAGDEDANGTFRSAELVHRLLFDAAIEHDYHLHRGAAHTGRSMDWRMPEVFAFLSRALNPPADPDPEAERHKRGAIRKGRYLPRTTNELPLKLVEFDRPD